MVIEKNTLWFCSFFPFSFFVFVFPIISLKVKNGLCHESHRQKGGSHFEAVCITKWTETSLVSPGTTVAVLATQLRFLLLTQMEHPRPDPCREGGWVMDEGVTGANVLLTEHQRCRAVGQGVFSILWNRMVYGTRRSWFQHSFKFLFQVAAEWSSAIIQSASTSSSSAATLDSIFGLLREDPLTSPLAQQAGPGHWILFPGEGNDAQAG